MHSMLSRATLVVAAFVASACNSCGSSDSAPGDTGAGDGGTTGVTIGTPPPPDTGGGGPTCGSADVAAGTKGYLGSQKITVGGAARSYELYVPEAYDGKKAWPLVFVLHGDGGTGSGIRGSFKLEAESGGGAIFVYPDGQNKTWVIDNATGLGKDIAFIDAVASSLAKTHCTDTKRVFAVGFSKGAYFANMLACLSKSNLRAVVTHAGGGPFGLDGSGTKFDNKGQLECPSPPVAALQVQGDADTAVPLSEGIKARDHWRRANACATTTKPYDAAPPCVAYDGCAEGRPEVWCQIPGMGHTIWPAMGAKVTWEFLRGK